MAGLPGLRLASLHAAAGEADITACGELSYRGHRLADCRLHDRPRARLLLLSGPAGEALWISADECTFRHDAAHAILAALERDAGLAPSRVLLAGTHAHSVHGYTAFQAGTFAAAILPLLPELRARLRPVAALSLRTARTPPSAPVLNRRIAFGPLGEHCCMFNDGCVIDAASGRVDAAPQLAAEAARLGTSLAELGLPAAGAWVDGPVDERLHLVELLDPAGRGIASVVRVNAHAVVASQSRVGAVVSADFVRPLEDAVRAALGGAPCLLFNGAFGDTRPRQREYSLAEAERIGRAWAAAMLAAPAEAHRAPALALVAADEPLPLRDDLPHDTAALREVQRACDDRLAALANAPPGVATALARRRCEDRRAAAGAQALPPPPEAAGILAAGELQRGTAIARLQAWRLGPLALLATGGEPCVRLAAAIESASGLLPLGAAGPYISYLPDAAACAAGGYEANECLFAPTALARLPALAAGLSREIPP